MSRKARRREKKSPHHIMCRSIPELMLFNNNEDKDKYLELISASAAMYRIEILAYCIMDNHVHMMVHPRGGDISKFMRKINTPYAKYYNQMYERRGHLFGERFKNIVIKSLDQLLRTSTYIHNNPKDLQHKGYKTIEAYPYSSIKDYVSPGKGRGIANPTYLFTMMGGGWNQACNHYADLLEIQSHGREKFKADMEKAFAEGGYKEEKKTFERKTNAKLVINKIAELLDVGNVEIRHIKYIKKHHRFKCLIAIALRIFCDMSLLEMTDEFRGHTSATIGLMAQKGFTDLEENPELFDELMISFS